MRIEQTGAAPSDEKESAILRLLGPGQYAATVRGVDDSSGIALVEAYDLSPKADSKLANIRTRGLVQTADDVMIGGFIVGNGQFETKVLVRAVVPSLSDKGVANPLQDPVLELHDRNGNLFAANDNWQDDPHASEIENDHLAPTDARESATLQSLPPGDYTAVVRGANDASGVTLVEIYKVRQRTLRSR